MQLTSVVLVLSAVVSASAYPGALQARQTLNITGPKDANFACDRGLNLVSKRLEEITRLKAQNITVPPYLAGYFSAVRSELEDIGCPDSLPIRKRQITPKNEPCDVINSQYERMMERVNRFKAGNISVAPYIAGFLSATIDGNKGLSCLPLTGSASKPATNISDSEGESAR